jgi:hypothetical protein
MSYTLSVTDRELWPYEAIQYSNGDIKWDIRPILYDTADISLMDVEKSYSLCYKETKSISGKNIQFVDVVDMDTGLFFSLQVSNIYYFCVTEGSPHIIAKVGKELIYYTDFARSKQNIEPDGDKWDLTPLGTFDMFIAYDDNYYYPIIFSKERRQLAKLEKFVDYYGWRSYTDPNGWEHFIIMIEDPRSTESDPYWYWVDNFVPISEKIIFPEDQYVENWTLDPYGNIIFDITNGSKFHIDKSVGKVIPGWDNLPASTNFSFVREYDDTDADAIVVKNDSGYFIIDRNKKNMSEEEQNSIVYFQKFVWCLSPSEASADAPRFLMMKNDVQIVLVDENSQILCGTDMAWEDEIVSASILEWVFSVETSNRWKLSYIVV